MSTSTELRDTGDLGSASLEFLTVGLLLLVPTVYLVVTFSAVQTAALGLEGAARQAARVFVREHAVSDAEAAAARAIKATASDYDLDAATIQVTVRCDPDPADCLQPHGAVTIGMTATVALPFLPPVLGLDSAGIAVSASATEQVPRFVGLP
ncbi:hypothetical protein [Homoserinibacter sp. GY 40078]|uniref:hypothetical protein n=1 Tax=Homoserinibacter sp. GY 40078 TaxID=2603275 RepID=UPI0011CBDD77|nr:hypothetical protein [Homoserinibacter sp. GY 40078]TXK19791.1 hypothetical protein FVQ89_08005 [Homoserinibacter sp. GY 40078]